MYYILYILKNMSKPNNQQKYGAKQPVDEDELKDNMVDNHVVSLFSNNFRIENEIQSATGKYDSDTDIAVYKKALAKSWKVSDNEIVIGVEYVDKQKTQKQVLFFVVKGNRTLKQIARRPYSGNMTPKK